LGADNAPNDTQAAGKFNLRLPEGLQFGRVLPLFGQTLMFTSVIISIEVYFEIS
jgi:hypothetical protein